MLKQSAKSPSAAVLHSEDSVARGTPRGGRFRSPSGLSTLKPIKSFWTAPGGQVRPPLLTPLTVWSVCWPSPGDYYKRKRVSCVERGKWINASTTQNLAGSLV
ncbi:hypothetical protein CEXT_34361 [Caerostris extrusa]|uniref:Uncharacterized protein n=1 Tax=Caerostris extrusa TaxID=172846 RepID=A0AAV4PK71_CAEEX|nr:hypothetical protein CEXT_34361 [Caerostris extrusa]